MKKIIYTTGDATAPQGNGPKIIIHICNDRGGWGKGFVLAISKRWRMPEQVYREAFDHNLPRELGVIQLVQVAPDLYVINMIAQVLGDPTGVNVRYDALEKCIQQVAEHAKHYLASVHMPRIGCGLAGGRWEAIEPLIQHYLCKEGIQPVVYDFKPQSPLPW